MLQINQLLYEQLAELLVDAIDGKEFFSDEIYIAQPQADHSFSATLMIYYKEHIYPEGARMQINNIVPIWWEFHSDTAQGEVLNDFDFNILKECICQ